MSEDEAEFKNKNVRWWNDPFVIFMLWAAVIYVLLVWAAVYLLGRLF